MLAGAGVDIGSMLSTVRRYEQIGFAGAGLEALREALAEAGEMRLALATGVDVVALQVLQVDLPH